MEHKSPAIVSTYSYINPLVAVLLGSLLLNERIVWLQIAAMIIILTGVLLINMPKYISKTVKA
jgi:drug/metabolite transporter (DMT)-like permease